MFRQSDWLAELQVVLGVAVAVAAVAVLWATGRAAFGATVSFTVPSASIDSLAVYLPTVLEPGVGIDLGGEIDVVAADPSAWQRLASLLTHLPSYAVALVILILLWRIVRTARRADPFTPRVARRLLRLGVIALAGGLLADMIQLAATFLGSETVFDGFASASYTYSWWWLLVGFGFLAVGEVVKRGAVLRAELDTVV
jgi:hypothetical protein